MNNNFFFTRSKVPILGAPQIKLSCQKLSKIQFGDPTFVIPSLNGI